MIKWWRNTLNDLKWNRVRWGCYTFFFLSLSLFFSLLFFFGGGKSSQGGHSDWTEDVKYKNVILINILNPFPTLLQCTIVYGTLTTSCLRLVPGTHKSHLRCFPVPHLIVNCMGWTASIIKKKKNTGPPSLEFAHLCYKQPYLLVPAHLPLAAAYFLSLIATLCCAGLLVPDDLHAIVWLLPEVSLPISDNTDRTLVMCKKRYSNITKIHLLQDTEVGTNFAAPTVKQVVH